jgi:hypothetical protein
MRITKTHLEDLAALRSQIKELQEQERHLTSLLSEGMNGTTEVKRGPYTLRKTEYAGQPAWKQAFIDACGEEAADALPRPTHTRLTITPC